MELALPSIGRRAVTVAPPRRGKHGVFALSGEGSVDELDWKPSLGLSDTSWTSGAPSWSSGFLPPATPRKLAPFAPDAGNHSLAPSGWAKKPLAPEAVDKTRLQTDSKELVEAKRALRGIVPGDWNAELFAKFKKKFTAEGRWLAIPGLQALALKTSEEALAAGCYAVSSHRGAKVRLPQKPTVQWLDINALIEPEPYQGIPPPVVVSHNTPLEAAGVCGKAFKGHPIVVTMEAVDFSKPGAGRGFGEGRLLEGEEARSLAQQEMHLCTNFVFASRMSKHLCAKGPNPKDRLTSNHGPSIFVADGVVVFRGPEKSGYPFLSAEEQLALTVLVSGRAVKLPWFGPKGENFRDAEDFICFMDRLNLITYKALSVGENEGKRPVLVLAASGLTDAENRQPRNSIAQALKTWRSMWAGYFEAVVVACGDVPTAAIIDRTVNTDIYMKAVQHQALQPGCWEWHWNVDFLRLSTNPVLGVLAAKQALLRNHSSSPKGSIVVSRRHSAEGRRMSGRRASGAGMMMLSEALSDNQKPAGAIIASHGPGRRQSDDGVRRVKSDVPMGHAKTDGHALVSKTQSAATEADVDILSDHATMSRRGSNASQGGGPRRRRSSAAFGAAGQMEDSRAQMERLAKLRLEEIQRTDDPLSGLREGPKNEDAHVINAQAAMALAAAALQEAGRAKTEQPASSQATTMTLEKKRAIDSCASMLDMPTELKNYVFKAIEREMKFANVGTGVEAEKPAEGGNDEEGDGEGEDKDSEEDEGPAPRGNEEAARMFEEVQNLAATLDEMITGRKKEEAGPGSLSARTPRKKQERALPKISAR